MTPRQAFLLVSGERHCPEIGQPQTLPAATGGRWKLIRTPVWQLVRSPLLYFPVVPGACVFEFYLWPGGA